MWHLASNFRSVPDEPRDLSLKVRSPFVWDPRFERFCGKVDKFVLRMQHVNLRIVCQRPHSDLMGHLASNFRCVPDEPRDLSLSL